MTNLKPRNAISLAELLRPMPKPRSPAQRIQSKLFQEAGTLAKLQINAVSFSRQLYGPDLAVAQKFVELVHAAAKKNKTAMQNISKSPKPG